MTKPTYQINQPVQTTQHLRYRRRARFIAIVLCVIGLVVAAVLYDLFRLKHATSPKPVGASFEQHIAGPQTFKNAYFEFSDTAKWTFAQNDSTATKFTYLLYESGVPVHSLSVYVNQVPLQNELATNRVLPVQLKNGNALTVNAAVSDDCKGLYSKTDPKRIKSVALAGTSFMCVPDAPQYSVVVGQVGGNYNLTLKRSDGTSARYIIIYHNLSVGPDSTPFVRIMKTFQSL